VSGHPVAGYGPDLAHVHEAGFAGLARDAATATLEILRRAGIGGLVVELGCGGGTSSRILADAGHEVLGVDLSPEMIRIARRRVPEATFRVGSAFATPIPDCAAVTAFGEVLNYAFEIEVGERHLMDLFRRVHAALVPGGLFALDLAGPGRAGSGAERRHASGEDWALLVEIEESADGRWLERRITTFRRAGSLYRRAEETHRLRLFRASETARWLRAAGFRVTIRRAYRDTSLAPGHRVLIARKPL
jgi:SAM-dependent methyltransferase